MMTSEYIEYCGDDFKMEIKSEVEGFELSENRKYAEYFEGDIKEEIVDEKNSHAKSVTYMCDICSKTNKSKRILKSHIQKVHEKIK